MKKSVAKKPVQPKKPAASGFATAMAKVKPFGPVQPKKKK